MVLGACVSGTTFYWIGVKLYDYTFDGTILLGVPKVPAVYEVLTSFSPLLILWSLLSIFDLGSKFESI